LLNSGIQSAEKPLARLLKGEPETRRSVQMKLRLYRMAFTASVVAVFLQGLGAGMKWS
jgi:hypothetical protein